VEEWIASLLLCGPRVLPIQKRLIVEWDRLSTTEGARAGVQAFVDAFRTDEPRKMMTAFVNRKEKRRKRR
jgi:enoyl-CoA hydratase